MKNSVNNEWFAQWFDSPFYHLLYNARSEAEAEKFIDNITRYLKIERGAKILDAACGKGRHAKTLAKLGFDVSGIDLSKQSIAEAQNSACGNLKFDVWDIRETYHPNSFNYVFNLFSSFGYFETDEDDSKVLSAFYDELLNDGTLVIDFFNSEKVVKEIKPREIIDRGEIQFHISKRVESGFVIKTIEFLVDGEHYQYEERVKLINLYRFQEMLTTAGFKLKQTFGDYDLNPFNHSDSPRLIMIATKK